MSAYIRIHQLRAQSSCIRDIQCIHHIYHLTYGCSKSTELQVMYAELQNTRDKCRKQKCHVISTSAHEYVKVQLSMFKYLSLLSLAAIYSQSCSLGLLALSAEYRMRVGLQCCLNAVIINTIYTLQSETSVSVPSMTSSWHVQKYHPSVLVQQQLHSLVLLEHSSISVSSAKTLQASSGLHGYTICNCLYSNVYIYIVPVLYTAVVPVSQFAPVHPEGQLHMSGSTHSPPLRHPPVQIAEGIYKGCHYINLHNICILTETA